MYRAFFLGKDLVIEKAGKIVRKHFKCYKTKKEALISLKDALEFRQNTIKNRIKKINTMLEENNIKDTL